MAGQEWRQNPAIILPRAWREFVDLWLSCRGEAGVAHWPDGGGVAHQAAWIVDAFAILATAEATLREERRNLGRG